MRIGKIIGYGLIAIFLVSFTYGVYYAWQTFPVMSGYAAKKMCSCVMLAGRDPSDVSKNELGRFPLSLSSAEANYSDSSASASVLGMATRKAIYRKGLGCSLLVESTEDEFRNQKVALATRPRVNQDSIAWPTGNLLSDSVPRGVAMNTINSWIDSAFAEPGPDKLRKTRAVVIVYDGKLIAERYAPPFDEKSLHTGWSMAKSVTNALIGILVKDGKLDLHAPAPIDTWKNDNRKKITLNHLMQANSGLEWKEDYRAFDGVNQMLFKKKDMGKFAAESKSATEPGVKFYYSSGTTNILSHIVRETVGDNEYYKFPYEKLFYRIGMLNTTLEPDAGGTFVGSSYCFAPARDWARFGLLYLQDGVWEGERILPTGWVKYTTTPANGALQGQYGAQFWLNAGAPANAADRIYPSVPTDLFWAEGYEGQNVFILPSKKLVVVRLGLTQGDVLDDDKFLAGIIAALP
jgi:CubicO group peptidase (beta-lactamase class C family)